MASIEPEILTRLRTFVRRRVPSSADADDVLQEVALRLVAQGQRATIASPHAWVAAIARRAVADFHRARARAGDELSDELAAESEAARTPAEVARCLAPLLARLAPEDRALLERVDVRGAAQSELAREMGVSASGLKSRVQRARARLRRALLERCEVELDRRGRPSGDARCRTSVAKRGGERGGCGG